MQRILVTGGAGYIGSHTVVELLKAGYEVIIVDNLHNSKAESVARIEQISGKTVQFHELDIRDKSALEAVFATAPIDAVIHFAALKAVGESVEKPLAYYQNNVTGTLVLCEVMRDYGVKNIVFSSSCTVYGDPDQVPVSEESPLKPATNPYGRSKQIMEDVLQDLYISDNAWNIALLRYFNPIGAHPSGLIGEDPNGIPNNLVPYVAQVAVGKLPYLRVFGNDYDTPDGSGVRDYIHVLDLAAGHVKALDKLATNPGVVIYNLGTGRGYSVLEVVAAFEKACGREIPFKFFPRRAGDVAMTYADPSKANRELVWTTERDIDDMCLDTWRWQSQNPDGYA